MSTSLKTEFLFLGRVGGAQVFLLFRPSTDQMTPNHIMKDNLLHSKSTDLNAAAAVAAAKSLQSCLTLCDPIDGSPRLPHPWDSPGKNTGVGCHSLLQCMKVKSESEVA